ncbi:hypothetical protein DERP_002603 [Dermatophagoides pteronyssinus]|uniref:Secreted protein n=1 Tax=Dermatophagoides pteronyssinus TaxID=6956 RepID=A0ABQ8JIZ0_DERPT|nr:hypothetical protein DERP_002603 [Dermatophagoides pteronyssinus]
MVIASSIFLASSPSICNRLIFSSNARFCALRCACSCFFDSPVSLRNFASTALVFTPTKTLANGSRTDIVFNIISSTFSDDLIIRSDGEIGSSWSARE